MFDAPQEARGKRAVRPRDAATLILVRKRAGEAEILMGQRSANHRFMPNKYVFPGGRLDPADVRLRAGTPLQSSVLEKVARGIGEAKANALARAAVREMFEEAGVLVGRHAAQRNKTRSSWAEFLATGVEPDLTRLDYVARAITPPYRDRRFDTRFFIADESAICEPDGHVRRESGELLSLRWVTVEEARTLDLPNITRRVIDEIELRVEHPEDARPVPFIYFRHGKPVQELV